MDKDYKIGFGDLNWFVKLCLIGGLFNVVMWVLGTIWGLIEVSA